MKLVHPHCHVVVDTEPWVQDVMAVLKGAHDISEFLWARGELDRRQERWQQWLIQHGYQAGRDYWPCEQGYRFSSDGQALMFVIGAQ